MTTSNYNATGAPGEFNKPIAPMVFKMLCSSLESNTIVDIVCWTKLSSGDYALIDHPCTANVDTMNSVCQSETTKSKYKKMDSLLKIHEEKIDVFSFVYNKIITIDILNVKNWSVEPSAEDRVTDIEKISERCAKTDTTPEKLRELAYNYTVKTETYMSFVDLHELNMAFENKFSIEQLLLLQDCDNLDHARRCWIKKLEERQAESINYIKREIESASAPELVDELERILELTESTITEAKTVLDKKSKLKDIISYWPAILLPSPGCVRYYTRFEMDSNIIE